MVNPISAQEEIADSLIYKDIAALVYLDSITIRPDNNDLNVEDFVQMVLADTSFYEAFEQLRIHAHKMDHTINYFTKNGNIKASYTGIHQQEITDLCRTMRVISKKETGKYYKKNGKYNFYTSQLIDRVFYTHGRQCFDTLSNVNTIPKSKLEGHINNLKQIIFNPGKEIEFPFVGKKMAIFSKNMRQYYDYAIKHHKDENSTNGMYIFSVKQKEEFKNTKNKTIIKEMITYFDDESNQVLQRNYTLQHDQKIYAFDININVILSKIDDIYIPAEVNYDGYWNVITRKPEICKFKFIMTEITK